MDCSKDVSEVDVSVLFDGEGSLMAIRMVYICIHRGPMTSENPEMILAICSTKRRDNLKRARGIPVCLPKRHIAAYVIVR